MKQNKINKIVEIITFFRLEAFSDYFTDTNNGTNNDTDKTKKC